MDEQANKKTSENGSKKGEISVSRALRKRASYDVPIPRPTFDLGFRGIRHKRTEYDSQTRRRRDN